MVTYGGEQSLDRYLALSARGIPFNVAHAAGNFAIALAAGPALVRMISRFRDPARVRPGGRPSAAPLAAISRSPAARSLGGRAAARPRAEAPRPASVGWLARGPERTTAASGPRPASRRARR